MWNMIPLPPCLTFVLGDKMTTSFWGLQPCPDLGSPICFSNSALNFIFGMLLPKKSTVISSNGPQPACLLQMFHRTSVLWLHHRRSGPCSISTPLPLKSQVTTLWIFSIQPFMKLQEAEMIHVLFQRWWDHNNSPSSSEWLMGDADNSPVKVTSVSAPRHMAIWNIFSLE